MTSKDMFLLSNDVQGKAKKFHEKKSNRGNNTNKVIDLLYCRLCDFSSIIFNDSRQFMEIIFSIRSHFT